MSLSQALTRPQSVRRAPGRAQTVGKHRPDETQATARATSLTATSDSMSDEQGGGTRPVPLRSATACQSSGSANHGAQKMHHGKGTALDHVLQASLEQARNALTAAQKREMRSRLYERLIIDPRHSSFIYLWDPFITICMLLVAFITPLEVAFIEASGCVDGWFVINRFIDIVFTIDIIVTFRLAHYDDLAGIWVTDGRSIASRYLKGALVIDLVSITPLWPLSFKGTTCTDGGLAAMTSNASMSGYAGADESRIVSAARLVRLLRLVRMVKASRVMKRLINVVFINKLEVKYAYISLIELVVYLVAFTHWQACLLGLVGSLQRSDESSTWISKQIDLGASDGTWQENFVLALYFSIGTVTGIGSDDLIPVTPTERLVVSFLKLASGCLWAFGIGTAAGIASTLDPDTVRFRNTMDHLNQFMKERRLPPQMRRLTRDYFASARGVHQLLTDEDLFGQMSPLLRGTVAIAANQEWIRQVWFLRHLGEQGDVNERLFLVHLSTRLRVEAFLQDERLPLGQLYVLRRGVVTRFWRFIGPRKVFGEE